MKKIFVATSLFCLAMFCLSGCDLGTYNKRLNERPPAPAPESDENGEEATDDSADESEEDNG